MEGMTNEQFRTALKIIIDIVKNAETKEEAIKKLKPSWKTKT